MRTIIRRNNLYQISTNKKSLVIKSGLTYLIIKNLLFFQSKIIYKYKKLSPFYKPKEIKIKIKSTPNVRET